MQTLLAVLVSAAGAGAAGLLVPRMIAAVPEPEPDPTSEEEPKPAYVDLAALPGLAWKSAVASALAGAAVGWGEGWQWTLLVIVPLVAPLVALAVIDWHTRLLPTYLIRRLYPAVIALVLVTFVITQVTGGLVGAALGFAVAFGWFYLMWFVYPKGLGFGDVRLAGVLGLALGYLGVGPLLIGVYAGFLLGGLGGLVLSALRIVHRRAVPFGPFMIVGALVGVAFGADLWSRLASGSG
jgi:leader peptidase (prepilin peptidase)/N-methyltransferase